MFRTARKKVRQEGLMPTDIRSPDMASIDMNGPYELSTTALTSTPTHVVLADVMSASPYPGQPIDTTESECRQLWLMSACRSGSWVRMHRKLQSIKGLIVLLLTSCAVSAIASTFLLLLNVILLNTGPLTLRPGMGFLTPWHMIFLSGPADICFIGMLKYSIGKLQALDAASEILNTQPWHQRIGQELRRTNMPLLPPELSRLSRALSDGETGHRCIPQFLAENLSVADHVSMMRLTDKVEGARRVVHGRETTIVLDGETKELVGRTLAALGHEKVSEAQDLDIIRM